MNIRFIWRASGKNLIFVILHNNLTSERELYTCMSSTIELIVLIQFWSFFVKNKKKNIRFLVFYCRRFHNSIYPALVRTGKGSNSADIRWHIVWTPDPGLHRCHHWGLAGHFVSSIWILIGAIFWYDKQCFLSWCMITIYTIIMFHIFLSLSYCVWT